MGRKKKKRNDARGYQQTSDPKPKIEDKQAMLSIPKKRSAPEGQLTLPTNAKVDVLSISASLHSKLENLLEKWRPFAPPLKRPPPSSFSPTEPRFVSKIAVIFDRLTDRGFLFDDIQRSMEALGSGVTYELALEWLVMHLKTEELPPLFTEGSVRDDVQQETSAAELTVVSVNPALTSDKGERQFEDNSLALSAVKKQQRKDIENDKAAEQAAKAALLAQYEYESESNASESGDTDVKEINVNSQDLENEADKSTDELTEGKMIVSRERAAIQALEEELKELEIDLKDEAANYMRSKHEIKDMKKRAQQLNGQLKKRRGKLIGLERKAENSKNQVQPESIGDTEENVSEFQPLSLFDDHDQTPVQQNVQQIDYAIEIPNDAIPASWTGKTPKSVLEGWCKKEGHPMPRFRKLEQNGCSLSIKVGKGAQNMVTEDQQGPMRVYADSMQCVALTALFRLVPGLPLYRLFPPFYRDLWNHWVQTETENRAKSEKEGNEIRETYIQSLLSTFKQSTPAETEGEIRRQPQSDQTQPVEINIKGQTPDEERKVSTARLRDEFLRLKSSNEYQSIFSERQNLPVFSYRENILEAVEKHSVIIISAETGAGKTTQVPQFLLESALSEESSSSVSILCTQPRRVAAMSVAERVACEMGQRGVGDLVGYQIRLESKRGPKTRLLFCTTGIILRRLVDDPTLHGITHVVVDEVHERQWQIDLLLVCLRTLTQKTRPDLKIILMSATLDAKLFSDFFREAPLIQVPGRTFPVKSYHLEDILESTGHIIEEGSRYAHRNGSRFEAVSMMVTSRGGQKHKEINDIIHDEQDLPDDFAQFSLQTRRSLERVNERVINFDLIVEVLYGIIKESMFRFNDDARLSFGAILIFLPGLGEIRALCERLSSTREFGQKDKYDLLPMHSKVSAKDQRRVFAPSRSGMRKIIVSTNIAETSVTIPDVTFVVDCGLHREIQRDKRSGTQKLVATWCSRANAKQRAGRAGRVTSGICLKLFSSRTEMLMRLNPEPEIKRIPLEEICMTVLGTGLSSSCRAFLSQTPQPPDEKAIDQALDNLFIIGAVEFEGDEAESKGKQKLTALGNHLTRLPVDARLGKLLVFGTIFGCTETALTLAAALSASQPLFVTTFDDQVELKASQKSFQRNETSDFKVLVNVWDAYASSIDPRQYCRKKGLNYNALREIGEAREQFCVLLRDIGLLSKERGLLGIKDDTWSIVHAILNATLYPFVASISERQGKEPFIADKQETLTIHATSVNKSLRTKLPSRWLVFHDKLATSSRVSISTSGFVSSFALLLFGPSLKIHFESRQASIDEWASVGVASKTAVMIQQLRSHLDVVLSSCIGHKRAPEVFDMSMEVIQSVCELLEGQV